MMRQDGNGPDRWEYETLRPPRGETRKEAEDPKAEVNELAAEGWRLVETIDYTGGGTKYILFERPARSDDADDRDDGGDTKADANDIDSTDADTSGDTDDTGAGDDADGSDATDDEGST